MAYVSIHYLHNIGRSVEEQMQELSLFFFLKKGRVSSKQRGVGREALQRGEQLKTKLSHMASACIKMSGRH